VGNNARARTEAQQIQEKQILRMESRKAMTQYHKVKQFHEIYNCNIGSRPVFPCDDERELRKKLLKEEFDEYLRAEEDNDLVEVADALGDMLYIIYGTAVSYGLPINDIFDEIHNSNLSKLDENGNPIRREDGKILKGPNYFKPDISSIINQNRKEGDL
jgi:predicted HAD superfamily Cof-like phosphohydrolase